MKGYLKRGLCGCIAAVMLFVTGCGDGSQEPVMPIEPNVPEAVDEVEKTPYVPAVSMEVTPIVDYTIPNVVPNVLVDRAGYEKQETKVAIIRGGRLPEMFYLKDALTHETVYSGKLEEIIYDEMQNLYAGYAEFSDFAKEGRFYIECDILGQSFRFEIAEVLYDGLLKELCEEMQSKASRGEMSVFEALMVLQAYEWYSAVFADEDGDKIPDILEALQQWIAHMETNGVEASREALYSAFLAKFSYLFQKTDYKYATDCLKRASAVFDKIQAGANQDADVFWALTEIYRATNLSKYRKQILQYKDFFADNSYLEQPEYVYGSMTYLVTRHSVNRDLCEVLMNNVMGRGEEISGKYEDLISPLKTGENAADEVLKCAVELSRANFVLNNYQYTNIIEEFLHYLMGRNPESVNYYESDTDKMGYLLLITQLVANRIKE